MASEHAARDGLVLSIVGKCGLRVLERFEEHQGVGASGVDFFALPDIPDAATRRDLVMSNQLLVTYRI